MQLLRHENSITMKNKKIELTMGNDGKAKRLLYRGCSLIDDLNGNVIDADRHHSFYLDYHQDLKQYSPSFNEVKVLEDTEAIKHIVFIDDKSELGLEYHLLMNSEDSRLYSYVIAKNNTDRKFAINELRTVYRLNKTLFPKSYTASRTGFQPTSNYTNQFTKLQDETYLVKDGELYSTSKIYSKYDYADYFADNAFWGFFGEKYGFWFVPVSTDYYPSGPLKQELMVHYDGILLNYMQGAHFGTGDFMLEPGWQKMYGPWCIYINDTPDKIADAAQTAQAEQQKWPYKWVNEKLYPKKRGRVAGQLKISSREQIRLKIVLSQGADSFEKASSGYIYYGETDEQGNFELENVRLGSYKMEAYTTEGHITDVFQKQIEVSKENTNLGQLVWQVPNEKIIWQLGTASHTTYPFKFHDQLRNTIWRSLVPANLTFEVGVSQEKEDWYCLQTDKGRWNINFRYFPNFEKKLILKIVLAGASKKAAQNENDRGRGDPWLEVSLNGVPIGRKQFLDDGAIYRNALKNGNYHVWEIKLNSKLLVADENVLSMRVVNGSIMYDTILLTTRGSEENE
ncbi:MAG: polysaccharide lyase family protein [Liquorilactobacillus ghanensis]|uniref:polysaccharide lyase family protein n=1 Tax=Liquorilactobacillus ghanensis TaxID=399370 RepID=UPI0039E9FAAB